MFKIIILVVVIVSVGLISYQQMTKDIPYRSAETIEAEMSDSSETELSESEINPNPYETEPDVSNGLTLNLSGRGLVETPKYVFEETTVETLNLSNNKLTGSLQAEIRFLQNLKVLDLSNNQFTGVPAEIGQLKLLEELNLSNNRITGLPLELGNLSNLKILNLKGNEYATSDLELIKEKLPATTVIEID